jgi:3-deoxy-D-manno-octulosonate 8-phosphate phosphatase (KDO 8-P phosphatase)
VSAVDWESALAGVRLVALDVDGVLTDGRFYLSDEGVETKAFSTRDGHGIRRLLAAGVEVAVISGRASRAVEHRMQELGVRHVFLGCADKVTAFEQLTASLGMEARECVYIGDDLPDLPLMRKVGFPVTVADAAVELRDFCPFTTHAAGGHGAVRELCDLVIASRARHQQG